ncbi:MAG: O-antigen ligase domain-containing protein [Chloroflexi bacterium]|nr:MAG: O-antigen ligase domain-containing protein [Chloroflexota bacterium]
MRTFKFTLPTEDLYRSGLRLLYSARHLLFGLMAVLLGVVVGRGLASPGSYQDVITYLVFGGWLVLCLLDPLTGLLAIILVNPFIETSIKLDLGKGIPDFSITRFGAAFLLTFLLARTAVRLHRLASPTRVEAAMLAAVAGMSAAVDASVNPTAALQRILTLYMVPYSLYFLTKNLVQDRSHLDRFLFALIIVGAYSGLYAAYEQLTGNILFTTADLKGRILYYGTEKIRVLRGLYGEPATFGRVFGMIIPINFYMMLEAPGRRRRFILLGTLGVSFLGLLLAYNRTPWITTLLGFVILQFVYPKFRRLFLALILVAGTLAFFSSDRLEESTFSERINSNSTLEGRTLRWETAFNMWKDKPLGGWGFDRYQYESGKYRPDGLRQNIRAVESTFMAILVATGLLGFVPWVTVLVLLLYLSIRLYIQARTPGWPGFVEDKLFAIFWAVFITYALGAWTVVVNHPMVHILFFTIAGALVGTHQHLMDADAETRRSTLQGGRAGSPARGSVNAPTL